MKIIYLPQNNCYGIKLFCFYFLFCPHKIKAIVCGRQNSYRLTAIQNEIK
jgi:hypothetical protein